MPIWWWILMGILVPLCIYGWWTDTGPDSYVEDD